MSLRKAVDAMCKSCGVDKTNPMHWKKQVEGCLRPTCPFFSVRRRTRDDVPVKKVE